MYCNFHYGAHIAPMFTQFLIYLFIGGVSMLSDVAFFMIGNALAVPVDYSIIGAFILSSAINYVLCILILFRHNARWKTPMEVSLFVLVVVIMMFADFGMTKALMALTGKLNLSKIMAAVAGVAVNFILRKWLVFQEKNKK